MGKATRKKLERMAARDEQLAVALASRSGPPKARGEVCAGSVMTHHIRKHSGYYIRDYGSWRYTGKSKDSEKQRLALIRHLFGKYPVPRFLEQVLAVDDDTNVRYIRWYITAAQGGSLYKTCTREFLSKKETHLFLQAPDNLTVEQAIWWAKAMAISDDIGVAYRMARSSIARRGAYWVEFWVDVHRFFTNNPVPLKEMDELLDYIMAEHRDNENWTIKKRSLEAIRRKSEEWHRAQYKMRHIGGGRWDGMNIPDWHMKTGKYDSNPQKSTQVEWFINEIRTGNELAREGQKMRHCVSSYKRTCMEGNTAIFSMWSNTPTQHDRRNLTIEVHVKRRQIGQVRGFANRLARPQEREILRKWAMDNGLTMSTWY